MPDTLGIPADDDVVLAIDLGGTKAAVALVAGDGTVLARKVVPAPHAAPRTTVARLREVAARLPGIEHARAVGLALPAIVSPEGHVLWAAQSVTEWTDAAAGDELRDAFGLPASVDFDGYAATAGEVIFGGLQDSRIVAVCIIGTGFGAGVWYEGRVIRASVGVAGAVGWHRWPDPDSHGPLGAALPGISAPAESVASGPGIVGLARRLAPAQDWPDARAVFRVARSGAPSARSGASAARVAIKQAATVAGVVAGSVVNVVGPDVVVWSGGVGARAPFASIATRVARLSCQPFAARRTRFIRSRLGVESSLMGAAAGALAVAQGRSRP